MKFNPLKYFSTLVVFTAALLAGWWMWNYYMQSPWTRDGKVRAELVEITS
ncbi:p-hydroxybenzoic acid efflux subunit AaeA|nr:p-hydroxybenzoic acid efflux subunit AaeA [Candidatus Pantoea persica]